MGDRGFKISQQKLVLNIDVDRCHIEGYAELTIWPLDEDLYHISLHCRQCTVTAVTVNSVAANFKHNDRLRDVGRGEQDFRDLRTYDALCQQAGDKGELVISKPKSVHLVATHQSQSEEEDCASSEEESDDDKDFKRRPFEALTVRVSYTLTEPHGGLRFVGVPPSPAFPQRVPQMYTDNQIRGARLWMPCLDTLRDRATWKMELTAPAAYVVVASGDLEEQVLNEDETLKTFYYNVDSPVAAHSIAITAAPFEILPDPRLKTLTHFCLPGRVTELEHTVTLVSAMVAFLHDWLAVPYPFGSLKTVFLQETYSLAASHAGVVILSTHLLYDETIIDQELDSCRALALAVAQQWFGCYFSCDDWSDIWLIYGLAGYVSSLFMRRAFGNNEYKFNIIKLVDELAELDAPDKPLYRKKYDSPWALLHDGLVEKKAPLVLYMLEKRVGREVVQSTIRLLCGGILDKDRYSLKTSAFESELTEQSTEKPVNVFVSNWIYRGGIPTFTCGYWYNKKLQTLEVALRQDGLSDPEDPFKGTLTIRVHEFEGAKDHILDIDAVYHIWNFQVSSKHRRSKKLAVKLNNEETVEVNVMQCIDSPILWIRIDPESEFLHRIHFVQNDYMWVHQLALDRDVVAQYEAVKALASVPTATALTRLEDTLYDDKTFYRIRCEAAKALGKNPLRPAVEVPEEEILEPIIREAEFRSGPDKLRKFFETNFCVYEDKHKPVRPNDFSDLTLYHLQKAMPEAFSLVRDDGRTPRPVFNLIMDLLTYNDNSTNPYSDNYYLAAVIRALPNLDTGDDADVALVRDHIVRQLNVEKLLPCYHNAITSACLDALAALESKGRIPPSTHLYDEYTRYGHFYEVRLSALAARLLTVPPSPAAVSAALALADGDTEPMVQHSVLASVARVPTWFVTENEENRRLMESIWQRLTGATTFDAKLRWGYRAVYAALFGTGSPVCHRRETLKIRLTPAVADGGERAFMSPTKGRESSRPTTPLRPPSRPASGLSSPSSTRPTDAPFARPGQPPTTPDARSPPVRSPATTGGAPVDGTLRSPQAATPTSPPARGGAFGAPGRGMAPRGKGPPPPGARRPLAGPLGAAGAPGGPRPPGAPGAGRAMMRGKGPPMGRANGPPRPLPVPGGPPVGIPGPPSDGQPATAGDHPAVAGPPVDASGRPPPPLPADGGAPTDEVGTGVGAGAEAAPSIPGAGAPGRGMPMRGRGIPRGAGPGRGVGAPRGAPVPRGAGAPRGGPPVPGRGGPPRGGGPPGARGGPPLRAMPPRGRGVPVRGAGPPLRGGVPGMRGGVPGMRGGAPRGAPRGGGPPRGRGGPPTGPQPAGVVPAVPGEQTPAIAAPEAMTPSESMPVAMAVPEDASNGPTAAHAVEPKPDVFAGAAPGVDVKPEQKPEPKPDVKPPVPRLVIARPQPAAVPAPSPAPPKATAAVSATCAALTAEEVSGTPLRPVQLEALVVGNGHPARAPPPAPVVAAAVGRTSPPADSAPIAVDRRKRSRSPEDPAAVGERPTKMQRTDDGNAAPPAPAADAAAAPTPRFKVKINLAAAAASGGGGASGSDDDDSDASAE